MAISVLSYFCTIAQNAEIKIDTIYYDKHWKIAQSPLFADFYRLTMCDAKNPQAGYKVRDYFITGELQGEGMCSYLGVNDDTQTVWEGKVVTYFKNGKLSSERTYENGKLNGDAITYYENGLMETNVSYSNGQKNGVALIFSNDGAQCQRVEYANDHLKHDYYELINESGLYSKFYLSDNSIKWDSPAETDIKSLYVDGEQMFYYENNGLFVGLRLNQSQNITSGKHYRIDVLLINGSYDAIEFHPGMISSSLLSDKGDIIPSMPLSIDEYTKKLSVRAGLLGLTAGIVGGLVAESAAQEAAYSSSKTSINSNYGEASISGGIGAAVGNRGWAVGAGVGASACAGSSNSTITTESYNGYAAFQAKMAVGAQVDAFNAELATNAASQIQEYLKSNTLQPGDTLKGFVMIPMNKKGSQLSVVLNINNAQYKFTWR